MCSRYYRCYITIDISMVDCYNNIVEVYKQGRSYNDYDKVLNNWCGKSQEKPKVSSNIAGASAYDEFKFD